MSGGAPRVFDWREQHDPVGCYDCERSNPHPIDIDTDGSVVYCDGSEARTWSMRSRVVGRRELASRALVWHAHPVIPQTPEAFEASLLYIAYHFGIVLRDGADRMAGRLLGTYIVSEREARLNRIAAVYPEAAAEARMAGRRGS